MARFLEAEFKRHTETDRPGDRVQNQKVAHCTYSEVLPITYSGLTNNGHVSELVLIARWEKKGNEMIGDRKYDIERS